MTSLFYSSSTKVSNMKVLMICGALTPNKGGGIAAVINNIGVCTI
jgi:hypothetical protein